MQIWWAASEETEGEPYPLYAASNLGSVTALLAYPLLIDPFLGLNIQRWLWAFAFAVFWCCVTASWLRAKPKILPPATVTDTPTTTSPIQWLIWSILPSTFLLSVTSYIVSEVGSFPLLWMLPLLAYLLSFIIVFGEKVPLSGLKNWWPETIVLCFIALVLLTRQGPVAIALIVFGLFLLSTTLHQILYEHRPRIVSCRAIFFGSARVEHSVASLETYCPPTVSTGDRILHIALDHHCCATVWERRGVLKWLAKVPIWLGTPRLLVWLLPVFPLILFVRPHSDIVDVRRNVYGSLHILHPKT